jgi:hypothetical protein
MGYCMMTEVSIDFRLSIKDRTCLTVLAARQNKSITEVIECCIHSTLTDYSEKGA